MKVLMKSGSLEIALRALQEGRPLQEFSENIDMIQNGREQLLLAAGCTRKEIANILERTKIAMMVERGGLSVEHVELLEALEKQYPDMVDTLKKYELISENMPSWEQVKSRLTHEILEKANKLQEPTLLIVPPVSRQAMIQATNVHKISLQQSHTQTMYLENDNFWNRGKLEGEELSWEVTIVTGVGDVKKDAAIKGSSYQRSKAWLKKYDDQGVDVIDNARTYLTLVMRGLATKKPIDKKGRTVLNAKILKKDSPIASGNWMYGRIYLYANALDWAYIRLRGAVRVL